MRRLDSLATAVALAALACSVACGSSTDDPADAATDAPSTDALLANDAVGSDASSSSDASDSASPNLGLHVVNGTSGAAGHLVDGQGATVQLHGADHSGSEWSCLYGSFFSGPTDQASIDALKTWKINAIRIPLNEDCWLDINGVAKGYGGAPYQAALKTYVDLLRKNGMYVILDLHWAAPGSVTAKGQLGMADADHAPTFWSQVAAAYASYNDGVIFDLFNEPFISDWNCWLKGGACAKDYNSATYTATGMAALLKAVRSAGADNVVIMGGLGYSSDFSQWVAMVESIPKLAAPLDGLTTKNVAASWHTYSDQSVQTLCPTQYNNYDANAKCAAGSVTAANYGIPPVLAAGFPIVVGEVGIGVDSSSIAPYTTTQAQMLATWLDGMLSWVDQQGQGYLGWDWNTVAGPLLITDFNGTPTPYFGATYKSHLSKL